MRAARGRRRRRAVLPCALALALAALPAAAPLAAADTSRPPRTAVAPADLTNDDDALPADPPSTQSPDSDDQGPSAPEEPSAAPEPTAPQSEPPAPAPSAGPQDPGAAPAPQPVRPEAPSAPTGPQGPPPAAPPADASAVGATQRATIAPRAPRLTAPRGGDDLNALVTRAAASGSGVTLTAGATYTLTKPLVIPDSVPFLDGNGATIRVSIKGSQSAPATAVEIAEGSSDTVVTNATIDLRGSSYTRAVGAASVSRVTISDLALTNVTYRGIEVTASTGPVSNVVISGNTISNVPGTARAKGQAYSLSVSGGFQETDPRFASSPSPFWDRYTTDGTVIPVRHAASAVTITGNTIDGGYYGISLSGVTSSLVQGNTATNNMRSLSMQNNTSGNVVEANTFTESHSSAIHLAYNSDSNTIRDNTVTSSQAQGQGLMQAFQSSDGNSFTGNTVTVTGSRPGWVLYVGTGASNTVFSGNTVSGAARKAFIGIESVWDYRSAGSGLSGPNPQSLMSEPVSAPTDSSKMTYNGGFGTLSGVTIESNTFTPGEAGVPLVYVGAEVSTGRSGTQQIIGNVAGLAIRGNTVVGDGFSQPILTHEGTLEGVGSAKVTFADDSVGTYQ